MSNKEDGKIREGVKSNGINRLLFSEEKGECSGSGRNDEASDFLRRNVSASSCSEQEKGLIEWAKENKCLFEEKDYLKIRSVFKYIKHGQESEVYSYGDGKYVLKVTDYMQYSQTPLDFLDYRITAHNIIFPETKYSLVGIYWDNDSKILYFITKQLFIKGEEEPMLYEIEDEMKKRGFVKDGTHSYILMGKDGKVHMRISDLHQGNFVKNKDGIFCIDPVIKIC